MKDDSRKDRYMLRDRLGKELLYFDGGMGTLLQERGLAPGELPETWNVEHPDVIREIHRRYIEAGSDIVLTNTFGANALKFHDEKCSLKEIVGAAVGHVKEAIREAGAGREIYTALDVGPTGKLLKPMGDLDFETAYEAFREVMVTVAGASSASAALGAISEDQSIFGKSMIFVAMAEGIALYGLIISFMILGQL